ncbi:hypothetical protein Tco_1230415, partial [Tanacetum coccineum]
MWRIGASRGLLRDLSRGLVASRGMQEGMFL